MHDTIVTPAVLPQRQTAVAPYPVESEDHVSLAMAPISSLFGPLVPRNAHRQPARTRKTYRAVA
ncbi:hypothetical protein FVA74_10050 [Salinibacterium sp. dk2585]|uniref:hypothetical protein n=1 Tax=unclassified Salinibacterium TaxID=2632331 RepID=UPI0011C24BB6|nr:MULTISPECIES: hypothetical protein [unclassified Salinibacterium]QEE61869.1 hypothetical protein FVA74_10050 [Salinibacterium sp. dk2585]TXK54576.1 hypothetical protein FVP63_05910 [Salinibacterium sp. dk5596]